jgi:hypothetical protein
MQAGGRAKAAGLPSQADASLGKKTEAATPDASLQKRAVQLSQLILGAVGASQVVQLQQESSVGGEEVKRREGEGAGVERDGTEAVKTLRTSSLQVPKGGGMQRFGMVSPQRQARRLPTWPGR